MLKTLPNSKAIQAYLALFNSNARFKRQTPCSADAIPNMPIHLKKDDKQKKIHGSKSIGSAIIHVHALSPSAPLCASMSFPALP